MRLALLAAGGLLLTAPGALAAPAQLGGQWNCMRSVVSASSMYDPQLRFTLERGSWTDLTFGPAHAVKGKASYAGGVLKLHSARGSLLHTLRWTAAGEGGAERLVEVLGPGDTARSGEVCYPAAGSGGAAAGERARN